MSSILLFNKLTKDSVKEAFCNKDAQNCSNAKEEAAEAAATTMDAITSYICNGLYKATDCPHLETVCSLIKKKEDNTKKKKSQGGQHGAAAKAEAAKIEKDCDGPAVKVETT
ncbi:hypothetical protein H0H87_001988, partial [Tephrocybe sp. NHM501043]